MLLLVNGATKTVKRHLDSRHLGHLLNPRKMNSVDMVNSTGLYWAADNDAFNGFNSDEFVRMLKKIRGQEKCLWVACPDVVGNAKATLDLFAQWEPIVHDYDLPVALVGQDGLESLEIPWDKFEAFFIGGSTKWKLSENAYKLAVEAKNRGKWVHMGRVNSIRRLEIARLYGCDSVDGSGFSRFPDQKIPPALEFMSKPNLQGVLF